MINEIRKLGKRRFITGECHETYFTGESFHTAQKSVATVSLIAGLGTAAELALQNHTKLKEVCLAIHHQILDALTPVEPFFNGDLENSLTNYLNLSFPGIDTEALMVPLKNEIAISNGSACTSHSYQQSQVLKAMQVPDGIIQSAIRISWCHMTEEANWMGIRDKIRDLI